MTAFTKMASAFAVLAALAPSIAHADDARIEDARKKAAALYPLCTKKASEADLKGAKGSHNAAKQFLELGRYDKAIESWNDAYTFDCSRPSVFYNLSNAYERNGDKPMTIAVLEIAIARDPEADKATLQAKVDNLKATILAEPVAPQPTKPPQAPADWSKLPPPSQPVAPPDMERPFGPAPWITFSVGAAALVTGIPVLIIGRGKVSKAETECPNHKCPGNDTSGISLGNTGNTMTGVGAGLLGGGAAIAIGSLIWQFAGNAPRAVQKPAATGASFTIVPSVSPALTGAMATGRF